MLEHLSPESKGVSLVPAKSEEPLLDICSPCSTCSLASSIVVHISEEERQKYEEEIRKLYKQLDDKVMARCRMRIVCVHECIHNGSCSVNTQVHSAYSTFIIHDNEFRLRLIVCNLATIRNRCQRGNSNILQQKALSFNLFNTSCFYVYAVLHRAVMCYFSCLYSIDYAEAIFVYCSGTVSMHGMPVFDIQYYIFYICGTLPIVD